MFFPDSFGNESMPEMFNRLQRFLQNIHLEHRLMRSNQDLVGFFTCIPAEHIEDAVRWCSPSFPEKKKSNFAASHILRNDILRHCLLVIPETFNVRTYATSFAAGSRQCHWHQIHQCWLTLPSTVSNNSGGKVIKQSYFDSVISSLSVATLTIGW